MNPNQRSQIVHDYLVLAVAGVLTAVGVYFFKFPNNFTTGGVTGLAVVFNAWWPHISQAMYSNILNIALMVVGILLLGSDFGVKTAVFTLWLTVLISLLEYFVPMGAPLTDEPLMELILAVLLPSVGAAMLFSVGASSGGTDVIAMLLKKYAHVYNTSTALLMADFAIGMLAFLVFDVKTGIFSVFGLMMRSVMTEGVLTNLNRRKYFHIITADPQPIQSFITTKLHRSATVFNGVGAYTGENRTLILTVVSPRQAIELRNFVRVHSSKNFLLITNTSEIFGRGFRANA